MENTSKTSYKIGLFNDSYPPVMDGVAVAVYNYAYWLQRKMKNIVVVTPYAPSADDSTEDFEVIRYASLPLLVRKPYRIGLPEISCGLKKRLYKKQMQLIHAHCPFSSGKLGREIAQKQHIPFVATFHSKYRDDFKRAVKSDKIADLMVRNVIKFFESADEVWIPQSAVEETMREYGYKGRVEVVDNGSDLVVRGNNFETQKREVREALNIPSDGLILLFVGQHIWEKNTKLIIEALALLKDIDFRMYFIGVGYAAEEMKRIVKEKGLTSKVRFLGAIYDRELLKKYYIATDLFLFPSLYDNAPLVVREAAAMHSPTILIENSTTADIVTDKVNGFLISNDAVSLANKISELNADPERIKMVGLNAANSLVHSWEEIIEEVEDRYNKLIIRKR